MKKMNRNVKAIAARIGAAALLSAVMGTTAFGGTWQTTAGGWQYLADNGQPVAGSWIVDNGQDYRIHENGIMATGWYQDMADGGRWYYLDPQSGAMRTGWIFDNGSWYFLDTRIGGPRGGMLTGWQWIDGKCYYLDPARGGAMAAGTTTPDGYWVDASGAWVDATGTPYYEAGKGISSTVSVPIFDGSAGAGTSAGTGGSSYSGSSYTYTDSEWDDYSDSSVQYGANDFPTGNYGMMSQDERDEVENAIQEFKDAYITDDMSDFEKEIVIIQWLVENCEYEKGDGWENATAYSCIVNGKAQCAGYADAFLQTAKACGLNARYIYNNLHAWNLIELDGDWYHVDVTFEDPIGSNGYGFDKLRNKYINLEDSQIKGVNYHHTWNPASASGTGTDYGPSVVAEYLESGNVDTSLGESFADSMDDFFEDIENEDGSNIIHYTSVSQAADDICAYLEKEIDSRAYSFSFVVRYPEEYTASVTGNYSKLVDINNDIEDEVNDRINDAYGDILKNPVKISLFLERDAQVCFYAHENGSIYYKEGQGKQISYTIHFVDVDGNDVGTQTGTSEKGGSIELQFPEGYSWISNESSNYEVNKGKASYGGESVHILAASDLDMDIRLREAASKKAKKADTQDADGAGDVKDNQDTKAVQETETIQEAVVEAE